MQELNKKLFVLTAGPLLVRTSMHMALDLIVETDGCSRCLNYMYAKYLPHNSTAVVLPVQRLGRVTSEY